MTEKIPYVLRRGTTINRTFGGGRVFPIDPPFVVPADGWYEAVVDEETGTATMRQAKKKWDGLTEPDDFKARQRKNVGDGGVQSGVEAAAVDVQPESPSPTPPPGVVVEWSVPLQQWVEVRLQQWVEVRGEGKVVRDIMNPPPEDVIREALIQGDSLRELGERPYACVLSAGDAAIMSHRHFQPALAALDQLLTEIEQVRNDGEYLAMAKDENQALRAELEQVTFDPISTRHEDGTVTVDWPEDKPPIARITRELLLLLVEAPNELLTELELLRSTLTAHELERLQVYANRLLDDKDALSGELEQVKAERDEAMEALETCWGEAYIGLLAPDGEHTLTVRENMGRALDAVITEARQALNALTPQEDKG